MPHSEVPMEPEETGGGFQVRDSAWNAALEELLEDWHKRAYAAQAAHYASADRLRRLNYIVGVPAIVFSSAVGTAIFAGIAKEAPHNGFVAGTSMVAAALVGLQTFLRFAERAGQHGTAGDWYSAIRRDVELIRHMPAGSRGKPKDCLDVLRKEMNRAAQDAPELSVRFWKREAKRFGVKEPLTPP